MSWLDYFGDVCKINISKAKPLLDLARYGHWYWPMLGIAIMSERPISIYLDPLGRLHNDNDAAISYDGLSLFYWHGIPVPERAVTNIQFVHCKRNIRRKEHRSATGIDVNIWMGTDFAGS